MSDTETQSAIVVGASSGIGEALAREFAASGYEVGLTARRREKLELIGDQLETQAYVAKMDVTDTEDAREGFRELADAMGEVDVVVLCAGVGYENRDLDWEQERETVDVNVRGFTALATAAMARFEQQGGGHLVGISSVAAHMANGALPAYPASKAFVSNYCDALRYRARNLEADVDVTTIEPGFVDTDMAGGTFWMCSPETAAAQIYRAVRRRKRHAYVTRRWWLVAGLLGLLPDVVKRRLFA
ncbi:SDR family NAD(P)-dependent oxidoreductase [Haloglomus litoreum]|uniref:SDR family NAD(P)-dependent oxidoreductase n=1 Tax=Haloglomus litoreum TaxID=3034026 RepID=UPI0023E89129|nr:SDR family NAD(P)-dependent oxidoreductase [Haloglomus sp. DT116]